MSSAATALTSDAEVLELAVVEWRALEVSLTRLVVAGYTGRDEASVLAHIEELRLLGVSPPPQVPMFYELDPSLVGTSPTVTGVGRRTSGEVEPVLLRVGGAWFLGVGSDHTDREIEREDIGLSKAACAKPLGPSVVAIPDPRDGTLDARWDECFIVSEVDEEDYQFGSMAELRRPSDLLAHLWDSPARPADDEDLVLFCGTVSVRHSEGFQFGSSWRVELRLPNVSLAHAYSVIPNSPAKSSLDS